MKKYPQEVIFPESRVRKSKKQRDDTREKKNKRRA